MDDPNYQFNLKKAVLKAILSESGVDVGSGQRAAHIDVTQACVALTEILAGFIASSPDCDKPSDVRKVTEAWRKMLHHLIMDTIKNGDRLPLFGGDSPPPIH
jgi:hypothetical protein